MAEMFYCLCFFFCWVYNLITYMYTGNLTMIAHNNWTRTFRINPLHSWGNTGSKLGQKFREKWLLPSGKIGGSFLGEKRSYQASASHFILMKTLWNFTWNTVMFLSFRTDRSGQTVQTQIRLLLEEQSDQGLHCLQFPLHLLDVLL